MGTKVSNHIYTQILGGLIMKDLIVSIGIGLSTGLMFAYGFGNVSVGIAAGVVWAIFYRIIFGTIKAKDRDNK